MSAPVSSNVSNVIGSIQECNLALITKGVDHYCCRWRIENIRSHISTGEFKSPVFSISNGDECYWYLSIQAVYGDAKQENCVVSARLFLDREQSDCKKVVAKYKLTVVLNDIQAHKCSLESSKIFEFTLNSGNNVGILSSNQLCNICGFINHLYVICEIMIERVIPKNYNNISTDFKLLLKNQSLTDVVLSVGEKTFLAHKAVLAARSSVFAAMFAHDMVENRGMVHIEDMEEDIVEKMLRYIYSEEVEKFEDSVNDLLIAADKYDLKGLQNKCEVFLITTLSSSNVFDILLLADSCNAKKLKAEAINFIAIRSTQLMKTSAWETICQSSPQLLQEIAETLVQSKFTAVEDETE